MTELPPATPANDSDVFSWPNQAKQYPLHGPPGITSIRTTFDADHEFAGAEVWTLVYRNRKGRVVGILNYYPQDLLPYERRGNVNLQVDPRRHRRGIGSALVRAAHERGWELDPYQQKYTVAGRALAEHLLPELPAQGDR